MRLASGYRLDNSFALASMLPRGGFGIIVNDMGQTVDITGARRITAKGANTAPRLGPSGWGLANNGAGSVSHFSFDKTGVVTGVNGWTVIAHINYKSYAGEQGICSGRGGAYDGGMFNFITNSSGLLRIEAGAQYFSTTALVDGRDYLVAFRSNDAANTSNMIINGVVDTSHGSDPGVGGLTYDPAVGMHDNGTFWRGIIYAFYYVPFEVPTIELQRLTANPFSIVKRSGPSAWFSQNASKLIAVAA